MFTITAQALPSAHIISGAGKKGLYIDKGEFRGGEAGKAFVFDEFKRIYVAKEKTERYILEFAEGTQQKAIQRPGFYTVKLDKVQNRLVMEFSQILGSKIDFQKFQKTVEKSPFVQSSRMTYDPEDSGLTLQLFLKENLAPHLQVEVFELEPKSGDGRLAMDIVYKKSAGKN